MGCSDSRGTQRGGLSEGTQVVEAMGGSNSWLSNITANKRRVRQVRGLSWERWDASTCPTGAVYCLLCDGEGGQL
jgi:hypothetical protein